MLNFEINKSIIYILYITWALNKQLSLSPMNIGDNEYFFDQQEP